MKIKSPFVCEKFGLRFSIEVMEVWCVIVVANSGTLYNLFPSYIFFRSSVYILINYVLFDRL